MSSAAAMAFPSSKADSQATAEDVKITSSFVNAMIPDLVRRRASKLPLLRKNWTAGLLNAEQSPPPPSPPPPYPEPSVVELAHESDDFRYSTPNGQSKNGIQWKYVGEGCRLVEHARQESAALDSEAELTRKMYIDGVGYLLKALPDLRSEESTQLEKYLPDSFEERGSQQTTEQPQLANTEAEADQNNYVYRLVTALTLYGILLASLILPILERCAAAAYRCDRQYRISERAMSSSAQAFSSLARGALQYLNEGKSGHEAMGFMLYAVEGASRGVLDGYGEALKRRGASDSRETESDASHL